MSHVLVTKTANASVAHMPIDLTDGEIDDLIKATVRDAMKGKFWVCAIRGYEGDERELYEIPEVRVFCRRLTERGFTASLHASTLFFKKEMPDLKKFMGGIEVWAVGENLMDENGNLDLNREMLLEWEKLLKKAEKRALSLISPQDGQHGGSFSFSRN